MDRDGAHGDVCIYLYNNWTKLSVLATDVPLSAGTWTWNIPPDQAPGVSYRIRVQSLADTARSDYSDGVFTIGSPSITVTSPNGGEIWQPGTSHAITWTPVAVTGNANVTCTRLDEASVLATVPVNTGSWAWNIAPGETPGLSYRIRVALASNLSVSDYSDWPFIIGGPPTVTVVSPNGGETWSRGTSHAITWTATSLSGNARIYLYNNWTKLEILAASVPISAGSWTWNIPSGEAPGGTYRIRVQSLTNTAL